MVNDGQKWLALAHEHERQTLVLPGHKQRPYHNRIINTWFYGVCANFAKRYSTNEHVLRDANRLTECALFGLRAENKFKIRFQLNYKKGF
jgi:hypothetical protein